MLYPTKTGDNPLWNGLQRVILAILHVNFTDNVVFYSYCLIIKEENSKGYRQEENHGGIYLYG